MGGAATITFSAAYSGSGNINTASTTNITINGTTGATVELPSSLSAVAIFTLADPAAIAKIVNINGDLTIGTLTTTAGTGAGSSTLNIAANKTLTITGAYSPTTDHTINASGANVVFTSTTGDLATTGFTFTTSNATNLTLNAAATNLGARSLKDLTVNGGSTTATGILAIAGNVTVNGGTLTGGAFAHTVSGNIAVTNPGELDLTGTTLDLAGTFTNNGGTVTTAADTKLTLTGGTSVTLPATIANLDDFTINKTGGASVTLAGNLQLAGDLQITEGTLNTLTYTFGVTGTSLIDNGGTITSTGGTKTFTAAVTINTGGNLTASAGTVDFNSVAVVLQSATSILNLGGTTSATVITAATNISGFTGNANVDLTLTRPGEITFPATMTSLKSLTIDNATAFGTLQSDLTLSGALTITNSAAAGLITGAHTINVGSISIADVANNKLNATNATLTSGAVTITGTTNGGTLVLTGATATLGAVTRGANGVITAGNTTSLTMNGAITLPAAVTALKNLTINSGTTAIAAGLTVGTAQTDKLEIASGATLDLAAITTGVTVNGIFAGAGTLDATDAAGISVALNGAVTFTGTIAGLSHATAGTELSLGLAAGYTASNYTLPTITGLEKLTLDRTGSTVKLGGNVTLGSTAAGALTLTNGTLDLNSFNVTLAVPGGDNLMVSPANAINNVINTGASGAYIALPSCGLSKANAAGMGINNMNVATNVAIRTYFESVPTPGGTSAKKYWQVTPDGVVTTYTLAYGTNDAAPVADNLLKVYEAPNAAFGTTGLTAISATYAEGPPTTLALTARSLGTAAPTFITIAADATTVGTGATASASGNWSDGTKWTGTGGSAPSSTQDVLVGGAYTITVDQDVTCASLTLANTASITVAAGKTLTVTGNIDITSTNNIILTNAGAKLVVAGTINGATGFTTDANSIIELNGNTSMTLPSSIATVHTLTVAKENASVTLSGNLDIKGSSTLYVVSGTLVVGDNTLTIGTALAPVTTVVEAGAKLDGYTGLALNKSIIFNGPVTGAGEIDIRGGGAAAIRTTQINNTLTFTGEMTSNEYSAIVSGTGAETNSFTLPSSVTSIASLTINKAATASVTLSEDLTIAGGFALTSGKLIGGTNSITVGGAYSGGASGTLDISGSTITFNGATHPDFTTNTPVHVTNSLTNMTVNTTGPGAVTFPTNITELNALRVNTTSSQNFNLANNLTLAGPLTIDRGEFTPNAFTLTVGGTTTIANAATAVLDMTGSTVVLNGPIVVDTLSAITNNNATNLTIGGTGAISNLATALDPNLLNLTMNRSGQSLYINDAAVIAGDLTITNGTVVGGSTALTVNSPGATVISSGGKLDVTATTTTTFNGALSGAGTFDAKGKAVVVNAAYNFTGNLITNSTTVLTFGGVTGDGDIMLNASVADLGTLVMSQTTTRTITLNSNLKIATALSLTGTAGVLTTGANILEITPAFTGAAGYTLNASNGTVKFGGTANFTAGTFTTNNATNLEFVGGVSTLPTTVSNINDLKFGNTSTLPAVDMTINGNLEITSGTITAVADKTINVYGMFSNAGTFEAANLTNLNLYGGMSGAAAGVNWINPRNINLTVLGSADQLSLPTGVDQLNKLTVNRANGVKINGILTVNAGGPALILTNGDLDLNGFSVTLGSATTQISENIAGGATVINTGSDGASVTTQATTAANIIASGIGVTKITGAANAVVRRYPKARRIAGVNVSVARYFQVTAGTMPSEIEFKYDNTELGTNSAGSMKVYTVTGTTDNFLTVSAIDSSSSTTNTPGDATGKVWAKAFSGVAPVSGDFFALASVSGSTGLVRIFNNAAGTGRWENSSNWYPSGVPTKDDDVVIGAYPVTIGGNGITYYAKSLSLESPSSALVPASALSSGDTVKLVVMGNINIQNAGGNIDGANSYGRLNIQIGDGVTPVTAEITPSQDYSPLAGANGFSAYNLTLSNAAVSQKTAHKIRISKDVNIEGTSVFDQVANSTLVMYGGSGAQAINVASIASLELQNLELENGAFVTTASNFIVKQNIKLDGPNDNFTANNGTITFQNVTADRDGWNVFPGATLKLWHVAINADENYAPVGDAQIQGDFTYSNVGGTETFSPVNGTVLFSGANQKNIINTAGAEDLLFNNLAVATGSSVLTSSSFYVKGDIDVKTNASLIADNGTISFPSTAAVATNNPTPSYIKNASNHTLVFNNLAVADVVYTSDSWKITGNLDLAATGTLSADKGTITFQNDVAKAIAVTAGGTLNFFKVSVADRAIITTATSFNVRNNATNASGAGIEVLGTGSFTSTAGAATFTVDTDPGVGAVKTISKASGATLKLYQLEVANAVNNNVTTASDFELTGTTNTFRNHNSGLGGFFTATAGTITFSGTTPTIVSAQPDVTTMNNILVNDVTLAIDANDYLNLTGNITVNGTNGVFNTTIPTGFLGLLKFNGTAQQKITGTSTQNTPVTLDRVTINKTTGSTADKSVVMELDVVMRDNVNFRTQLALNSGYLNLGSKKLTLGAGTVTYTHLGAINGATGTLYNVQNLNATAGAAENAILLRDELFTVDNVPTLYNWTMGHAATLDGNLTVNGTLALEQAAANVLTIGNNTLTQNGNLRRTTGEIATAPGKLLLTGTGSVSNFSNNYFANGTCAINLEIARAEALSGNLTIAAGKELAINTGINVFNIDINKLTTTGSATINRISGSITAGTNSTVDLGTGIATIPANLFTNNTCYNLTLTGGSGRTLTSDLRIEGTLAGTLQNITTGDANVLTFGPSAVLPAYTSAAHVIGNLRRTVTSSATKFDVGDGSATTYRPVELNFATSGSIQEITVSSKNVEPTIGRAGNPKNAVDVLYTFTPVGTNVNDSLKVKYQWASNLEGNGQQATVTNGSFPAKWENGVWNDYRNKLSTFTSANPRVLTMSGFPVANPTALKGEWAIFNATAKTDVAKNKAISQTENKVVITKINPTPVELNKPFRVTVQLQDQYGQPITASSAFAVSVNQEIGSATLSANITGVITAGNSMVELTGIYTGAGANVQLKADTTGGSDNWQPTVSNLYNVLAATPSVQATNITLTNITNTTATINWINGNPTNALIVIKADTLLIEGKEYPVSGTSYTANSLFGAGSPLGDAVVINKATTSGAFTVKGLSPNTKYYVYAFAFSGSNGTENYKITPASGNPKILNTTGSTDDDVAFGGNDTRTTSKTIGTNTPVTGTIGSSTDEDWFNFSVTSASPNVRTQLYGLANNYNVEVYDMAGRRIRRGIRTATGSEGPVVNDLPAGTYTVRIYSADGSYSSTNTYTLKVGTKSSEIFSVTP